MDDATMEKNVKSKISFPKIFQRLFQRFFSRLENRKWIKGFSEDIQREGLIMLMACRENEQSTEEFPHHLTVGLQGYANDNEDSMVSAEEAFDYAYKKITDSYPEYQPVMIDNYPGEFLLSSVDLPPDVPELTVGSKIFKVGETQDFFSVSSDPENNAIKYGWDWNAETPYYHWEWYGDVDIWTDQYESGEICTLSHSWDESGIYHIRVKARDIHGAEQLPSYDKAVWSQPISVIVCTEDEKVDQWQIEPEDVSLRIPCDPMAQSFKPNSSGLTKIRIKLCFDANGDSYPLTLAIREDLDGVNLIKIQKIVETSDVMDDLVVKEEWIEFILNDPLVLIPDSTYYIVLESSYSGDGVFGWHHTEQDEYQNGNAYDCNPNWRKSYYAEDYCFVTYE